MNMLVFDWENPLKFQAKWNIYHSAVFNSSQVMQLSSS